MSKADQVAEVLVIKLGLAPAEAARRAEAMDVEQRDIVLELAKLPLAGNFITTYFDLEAMSRVAEPDLEQLARARDDFAVAIKQAQVQKQKADEQAATKVAKSSPAKPSITPPPVAEAATDVESAKSLEPAKPKKQK